MSGEQSSRHWNEFSSSQAQTSIIPTDSESRDKYACENAERETLPGDTGMAGQGTSPCNCHLADVSFIVPGERQVIAWRIVSIMINC